MNLDEQRRLGMKLAAGADANETLAAIKDTDKCYEEIFKTAAAELGSDKLAAILLENDPSWAFQALRALPDEFGDGREKLAASAAALHEKLIQVSSAENVTEDASQANFIGLDLIAGAAFECWFTMFWQNTENGPIFPAAAQSDNSQWHWSIKMSVNNSQWGAYCYEFGLPNAPVQEGALCWMVVAINAGSWYELKTFDFRYNTNVGPKIINTWGAVTNPQFGLPNSAEAETEKAADA